MNHQPYATSAPIPAQIGHEMWRGARRAREVACERPERGEPGAGRRPTLRRGGMRRSGYRARPPGTDGGAPPGVNTTSTPVPLSGNYRYDHQYGSGDART